MNWEYIHNTAHNFELA